MKTTVKITVKTKENGNIIKQYLTNYDIPENETVEQIKPIFADEYRISDDYELDSTSILFRNEELKDTDIVKIKSGIEYSLVLKKKGLNPTV